MALSPLAKRLIGATATELSIFDVRRGTLLEKVTTGHRGICTVTFSADGRRLLSGGKEDGRLRLWRIEEKPGVI